MLEKQHEPIAFELAQSAGMKNQQILYLCDSDKEARLINNELKLFMNSSLIGYYPERELLPYDRFSTADSIIQERINLLNANKKNFRIIITSCVNLFEKLPSKDFFVARKNFKVNDLLSIKELTRTLENLNYERTDKVNAINQYTVRGGVVDFYSGFQLHPIRVDFFGDQIDDIREFDPQTQNMTKKLTEFLKSLKSLASESYSTVNTPTQYASVEAYAYEHDQYKLKVRAILKAIGNYVYNNLKSNKILIAPPQGAFYLMPEFINKKYKTSSKLCEAILNDTGVAMLPGSDFGFNPKKMLTRLSYTDFDGIEFFKNVTNCKLIDDEMIKKYAPNVVEGVSKLSNWVKNL